MDHLCKSLESSSVQALVEISEEAYHPKLVKQSTASQPASPKKAPRLPTLRTLTKRSTAVTPLATSHSHSSPTPRAQTSLKRIKSATKNRSQQLRPTPQSVVPSCGFVYLDPFRPVLSSLAASGCKCAFVGGGGFKAMNKEVPCNSALCINRFSLKYQWKSEGDFRLKKSQKSTVLDKPQQQGRPVTESWLSLQMKAGHVSPRPLPRLPIKLQRRFCKMVGSKSTLTLRPKIALDEGMLRVTVKVSPKSHLLPAIDFGWGEKWLTGEEYEHILRNAEMYCREYGFEKYGPRQHPMAIYEEPYNGLMYFVEGKTVGSEFGFPRVDIKKKYRWKKMNFTTDLPKRQPVVTYIVASAIKCEKFFPVHSDGPSFRMHAVVLTDQLANTFILCHVRKLSEGEESCLLPTSTRTKRKPSPCPLKKPKKEDSGIIDGLYALLEAAEREEIMCKKLMECESSDDEDCDDQSQKLATAASSGDILAQI